MSHTLPLTSLSDTQRFAEILGSRLRCGDVVTLAGDLGAGKTTFTQFLIHSLSLDPVEVTSPTFTLLQTYPVTLADGTQVELHHYDLYRVAHPSALVELGIEDALSQLVIIEWPERLGDMRLPVALALSFSLANDGTRSVTLQGDVSRWSELIV